LIPVPAEETKQATWSIWEYQNNQFTQKTYGIEISQDMPSIHPDERCGSAGYEHSKWIMRSGYGISIQYTPSIVVANGCVMPNESAYTAVQHVAVTLPEFEYDNMTSLYRTLKRLDDKFVFNENDQHQSLHYIPVAMPDGRYTVSVIASQVWTPAGMITARRNSNEIIIAGSIYDDWYQR